jgi:hypothetical protein
MMHGDNLTASHVWSTEAKHIHLGAASESNAVQNYAVSLLFLAMAAQGARMPLILVPTTAKKGRAVISVP